MLCAWRLAHGVARPLRVAARAVGQGAGAGGADSEQAAVQLVDHKPAGQGGAGQRLSNAQVSKLQRGLETPKKRLLTSAERGSLDAESEDMMDVLNEALASPAMHDLFRRTGNASKYVEFTSVLQNTDRSHTTVLWSSSVLDKFARHMRKEKGEEEAEAFAKKAVAHVNTLLQRREPQFRSLLTKKMSFKRVPRLFLRPADPSLGLRDSDQLGPDHRQRILREAGANKSK